MAKKYTSTTNKVKDTISTTSTAINGKYRTDTTTLTTGKGAYSTTTSTTTKLLGFSGVLKIIFLFLLVGLLFRVLKGNTGLPTFTSFLDTLQGVPNLSNSWLANVNLTIITDWGAFNGFRDFLNLLIEPIEIIFTMINGIGQVLIYLFYFVRWLFAI